jgi:hypothetical protein
VPAGNPLRFTTKVTATGPVKFPDASLGPSNVMVASPLPPDSALVIGGFSLAVDSAAVNVGLVGVVDGDVDDFEQPAATNARATANRDKRFI